MAGQEQLRRSELMILQKEEIALRQMMDKYKNTLNRLQVEELTIRNQMGRIQDVELKSRNTTPLDSIHDASYSYDANQFQSIPDGPDKIIGHDVTMNELQINQSTLNLDAAPLIQRMLQDSQVYEEEEEEEEEEECAG